MIEGGWKSEEVKESLDLCLACKGCQGDCPMQVDMATSKAEFLSHYYAGRLRPRAAYAMGLVYWWARLVSKVPNLVNLAARLPGLSQLAKLAAGVSQERSLPKLAPETFTAWFRRRPAPTPAGPRVLVWPDRFNNFFHPEVARAATEVLEAAGFRPELPEQQLCCGRPLDDYGMLTLAKRQLTQILDALEPALLEDVPVVVLEPSCAAVLKDELTELLPGDARTSSRRRCSRWRSSSASTRSTGRCRGSRGSPSSTVTATRRRRSGSTTPRSC